MNLIDIQQKASQLAAERDKAYGQVVEQFYILNALEKEVTQLKARGKLSDSDTAILKQRLAEIDSAQQNLAEMKKGVLEGRTRELADYQAMFDATPQKLIEQMPDNLPFVLFPVRIETHFHSEGDTHELWVRVYPDEITTFTHEKDLTADEIESGETYWRQVWATRTETDEASKQQRTTLWNGLANRFGANRAAWVARQTQPTNWSAQWRTLSELLLKPQNTPKSQPWTQAPHTRLMPNQFVVMAFSGVRKVLETVGNPIPDYLVMGPDPLQMESSFGRDADNKLVYSREMAWLFDFDEALAVGMAVKMTLPSPWFQRGFDRLVVLGVRFSTDAVQNQQLLEELVQNHNYSAEGISILPQGTPTNNTDKATAGPSASIDRQQEVEENTPYFSPVDDYYQQSDGQRFAEALGVSNESVSFVPNAGWNDVREALAMNNALWPATWGLFLNDLLKPLVSRSRQALARQFFTEFVTGRGGLPAIRVGNQPYGLLVTSDFNSWQFTDAELGTDKDFWMKLLAILQQLQSQWETLRPQVAFAGKEGSNPENLMNILGLQASSVVFHSRKAVTDSYAWNYLNFRTLTPQTVGLWGRLQRAKEQQFTALGFNAATDFLLKKLIFQSATDALNGPVIDADPRTPLSETALIQPFNGTDNYMDWLLTSDLQTIRNGQFLDANNQPVAAPKALLYQLLHRAYLEEFGQRIADWLVDQRFLQDLPVEGQIQNMEGRQDITKADYFQLDAAKLRLSQTAMPVGEYIRTLIPKPGEPYNGPTEMLPLMGVIDALRTLRGLPTARLERLFAEHLDLCSYRLDAWQTGLFARRLFNLQHTEKNEYLRKGTYLGAYGWVENLRPNTTKTGFPQDQYPAPLQDSKNKTIYEDAANGGHIQTPSLRHATTAALLRNAYLSHGDDNAQFAVNLSSERVRQALSYLDGIRNGQELAALLGYQFERGLHDRGLLLNQYIYVLRDRFPLTAKQLTPVPDNAPQEVVEARNVINGYDLLDYARSHPTLQGIASLPADGTTEKQAILDELNRLTDTLDAIADLSLSESVFQAVHGNYDRAGGMMQAISEGKMPATPEIVDTPRSGTAITHRVAVCLQTDGVDDQHPAWSGPASPRSKANPFVNYWLGQRLPQAASIQFQCQAGAVDDILSFAQFSLQPLDLVLMTGSELGALSSEIERWLTFQIRQNFNISDGQLITFDFHKAGANGVSFAVLLPLLRSLKKIVTEARPLHALDFFPQTQSYLEGVANPSGYQDLATCKTDLEASSVELNARASNLKTAADQLSTEIATARTNQLTSVASGTLNTVRAALLAIADYGWSDALPTSTDATSLPIADALLAQAQGMVSSIQKQLATVDFTGFETISPDQQLDRCRDVARRVYGQSFSWIPRFLFQNQSQLDDALEHSKEMLSGEPELVMENWLQSVARVRPEMENVETLALHHDLYQDQPFELTPLQLPWVSGEKWVGETFSESQRNQERMSIVVHQAPADMTLPQAGWLLDEWTELIPTDQETTGIAFHYNRPNASPPQAILLAVPPVLTGKWTWDELVGILYDTLERAKRRAVEPDMLTTTGYFQILPAVLNDFSTGGLSTIFTKGSTLLKN
ncbi:hypothetical protein [Spirosoma endbachense]|uniref:Uncharacterized protein n=1 Tax=Spirosoma endbachense TaxID=2666025 RepID=A0A6P1VQY9_9BACT|nr:hypothetical protein [Spirosoma endbachense]QHV95034.1 hypothetical protein GJR95_08365 [Spirosoma endbachense]